MSAASCLSGGGEAGKLARSVDWAKTPLGSPATWSQALRSTAALVLHADWPLLLWWGDELTQIYNDAYTPVLGDKHPRAMGQAFRECWHEVFHILGPMAEQPYRGGPPTKADDIALPIDRRVPREESHFRLAYNPVPDETVPSGIGGVLAIVTEITEQVYAERQLHTLGELAARSANARTVAQACQLAATVLEGNAWDIPFALFYLTDDAGTHLSASARIVDGAQWPIDDALRSREIVVLDRFPEQVPHSPWDERPRQAIVLPLAGYGALVCGLSPHRPLDVHYRAFFELIASQAVAALRNARDYAEEQRRVEQLAALDRAKTTFFSNISHEFRTPLTLMIGPTEDALAAEPAVLAGPALETVHRNELRLLRLVNTLLDFSRIEAGRVQATYERVDLAELTRALASTFEPAIVRGGLHYEIAPDPVGDDLYVDRDQWEKIVLNLLSNAFKFTFAGTIRIALRRENDRAILSVTDTGSGIPPAELPRVFERFHRIDGARSRTNEGSGIGLALVHDLVGLHGGTIDIASELGQGTTVRVSIPAGNAHLPADRVTTETKTTPPLGLNAFSTEALRWVEPEPASSSEPTGARVLLADDNADMRDYVSRLLRAQGYAVEAVGDGEAALELVRAKRPDLVVTDIMMPKLDGFGLLRALRADPGTSTMPVIVLSARAGEEARIEGLDRGASDYLVKPFSARELIARVQAQLASSQLQRVEANARSRLEAMIAQAPVAIALYRGPTHVFELANQAAQEVIGVRDMIGKPVAEVLPRPQNAGLIAALDHVYRTGETFMAEDFAVTFSRDGTPSEHRFKLYLVPMREPDGAISGLFTIGVEITDVVMARAEAERANRAKDEFLAILGHELRNPLAPILTALDIMRLRRADAPRELDVIERQAHHLVRLVDDLLDVSRITRGKLELHARRIELAHVVARAAETAMPLVEQRGHQLDIVVPDRGLVVEADLDRLAQAVANLLTNAAKYTERGGTISVTGRRVGDEVELTVRDNGIGIAAEILPNVFDMFVQERQTLDRSAGGLGLGLTIVRSLVAMHGGRVAVASEGHGRGSVFTITLPVAAATSADAPETVARPELPSGDGRSVLVVDDNVDAADLLATSLEMLGFTTRIAHDGAEALHIVESFAPDIAVLDIGLPVMDGFELAGRLREKLQSVRLVALTGYGTETDRRRSREAGFDAHLVKPVALDKLREAVTRA